MIAVCIILLALFLFWAFFVTSVDQALGRLGETLSTQHTKNCFYLPKRSFETLSFSSMLSGNIAKLLYSGAYVVLLVLLQPMEWWETLLLALLGLFFILLIGDFFPRLFAARGAERTLLATAPIASIFLYLSLPFSLLFLLIMRGEVKDEKAVPLEELREAVAQILQSANVSGKLSSADKKLIEAVVKFKDRIVREVMVPRVDLFCIASTTSIRDASKLLVQEGYSRTPVYRETVDNIIGVLMFKDILQLYMDVEEGKKERSILDAPIDTITKSVFYTPETKKVSHLLQEFRTKLMHMAIVVDEYGGTEGVVTIEDILEEIVGEISDEYDVDEEMLYSAQPGGGSWVVDARMSVFDAEDIFDIDIPQEGDYDTIGGYIFHKIGSIPAPGLRIHHDDFDLEILSSTERSVDKVRITPRRSEKET